MNQKSSITNFSSISRLMRYLGQSAPLHPLIAFVDYNQTPINSFEAGVKISLDFYKISFKDKFSGQVKYGQGHYDFEEGGLAFLKPKQVVTISNNFDTYEGFALYFHPDFIRNYSLGKIMNRYGFFSYDVSEALFLSEKEKHIISDLFKTMTVELDNNIDPFSQDVLVSQIELLLNYSNRYYNRQFITRKNVNHKIMTALDNLLNEHFKMDNGLKNGLPTVQIVSEKLNVSPRYLSDMLRSLTGLNTQKYIQNKVIEQSKDLLSSTTLSVAEIAYKLGFEHPQSFNKLFKTKTNLSPLVYRQSFN
ncbi:AraC family transcriptional regulator [Cellulophaga baltica]|uniref:helix-turn-helix domain-containing protein n=1 Tax=Cellulophaga baltica TaxID=76594 RepID=UPI00214873C5|nr:AraC family transcriptional regulator [Cellulophaga baltica]MCR1026971.1 AraC family transcriptional regulator [Cellulophaga baltica]